jgi:hypothetical protein
LFIVLTFFKEVRMKRALYLLSAVALGAAVFTGCGLVNPVDADKADLILTNDTVTVSAGQSVAINGSVDASVVPTIVFAPSNAALTVPGTVLTPSEKKFKLSDINLVVSAAANAASGTYSVEISVVAGTVTTTKNQYVKVAGAATTPVVTTTVTLGSNNNAAAGSVDLDNMATYTGALAASHLADIDLCYAYSGTGGTDKLFSPAQAKVSDFDFTKTWTGTPNATKFFKLSGTTFASVTTKEAVAALWVEGSAQTASLPAAQGDVFIAKTNADVIVLLSIDAQVPGATGTISLKASK